MDVDQEIIPYCNSQQVALDFADQLPSGYRFNPTDSELIVDYLNAKIESRELPKCRLHEVNIYNHTPKELTERYRSHENKWYFLTSRDRKYRKGNRPDRAVLGKRGSWRTTQVQKPVHDATRQMVGNKGTLAFTDENKGKTMWLMHEYTTNEPNLPFESGDNGKKLNEWVLCKIYKKEQTTNSHGTEEVGSIMNPIEVTEEPNITPDILLPQRRRVPKRRRVSETCEVNFSNHHEQVDVQEADCHLDTHVQMPAHVEIQQSTNKFNDYLTNPMETAHIWLNQGVAYNNGHTVSQIRMNSSPYPVPMQPMTTFQGWGLTACYQNQFTLNASNGCQISDSSSGPVSIEPPASSAQSLDNDALKTPTTEHGLNSIQQGQQDQCYQDMFSSTACDGEFLFSNGVLNSSSMEPLDYCGYTPVSVQNSHEDAPTLLDVQIVWDQDNVDVDDDFHFPQSNGYEATTSARVEVDWSLDIVEAHLDDVNTTPLEID